MATTDSQQTTQTSITSEGGITGNDTFSAGATLTSQLNFISDGVNFYYWTGDFDKVVPSDSTPEDTGGIGDGAWKVAGDAAIRADLSSSNGAKLMGGLGFLTPEMYGAVGDGVTDDRAAIQAAINASLASSYKMKVVGMGIYGISGSITVDNFSRGLNLDLAGLTVISAFPDSTDWKDATPAILVGESSSGSQVGLEISIGYFNGGDKASLYRLEGYGAGGSRFHAGRVRNAIGVYQVGDHTLSSQCASNIVTGDYWYSGTFGVRIKRNGSYIAEGHKIQVGFMTNLKYGGIQLFNGAQYFQIYASDIDFCGRYLTQLTLNALPSTDVRGLNAVSGDVSCEILDYYEFPRGTYKVLVIEDHDTTGGNSSYNSGSIVSINGVDYTVSTVTTSTTNQFYFDFIHGFQGGSFGRGEAQFGYLSRFVGGMMHTSFFKYHNSFDINSNSLNGMFVNNSGSALSIADKWADKTLLNFNTSGTTPILTLPGALVVSGDTTYSGKVYTAGYRVFGSESNITLTSGTSFTVRTFSFVGNGTVTTTKEMWNVYVAGPTGLSGVGGVLQILVGSSGIELFGSGNINYPTLTTSGYSLIATQNAQSSMSVTFMFERKM